MKWKDYLFVFVVAISFPIYYFMLQNSHSISLLFLNFIVGIYLLVVGSDYFVDGASGIATHMKVSEHTIGLTVVALATSLPEMAVSDIASFYGHSETAWGNAVGSNIANVGLVLGIAAIIMPLALSKYIRRDAITLLLITALLMLFIYVFHSLLWWMGLVFIIIYAIYLNDIHGREEEIEDSHTDISLLGAIALTVLGALGIVWGANVLVDSAIGISIVFGVPEIIIATTAVAVGTSLPELATTVSATIKKKHGIAVGNILGSNIFNTLVVLGTAAILHPIGTNYRGFLITSLFLIVMTTLIVAFSIHRKLGKLEGAIFLITYAVFIYSLIT